MEIIIRIGQLYGKCVLVVMEIEVIIIIPFSPGSPMLPGDPFLPSIPGTPVFPGCPF